MSASGTKYRSTTRTMILALAGLLVLGIAGSLMMSLRARNDATRQIVDQAKTLSERSLTLVFTPEDLDAPVDTERAATLAQQITTTVLEPSDFTAVILYGSDGTILFATDVGRIGTQLAGEEGRIREALKAVPQTRLTADDFSVLVSFRFPSGVGQAAGVELTRSNAPITGAAAPWRAMALFLFVVLVLLGLVGYGVHRIGQAAAMAAASRPAETLRPADHVPGTTSRPLSIPQPGLREEAEARKRSEERARAAEDRLTLLQEQYRKTLEELQGFQRLAREPQGDPLLEERALRAEGQVQTLQQQLQLVMTEREALAAELHDPTRHGASTGGTSDAEHDAALEHARRDAAGLRAELEGAQTQLEVTRRELTTLRAEVAGGAASGSADDRSAMHAELATTKDALATATSQLRSAQRELEDARTETRALRTEEQRAAMLEDELRAARAENQSLQATQRAELIEREAELEEKVRATREEFQRQLADIEASYRGQLGKREADLASRITEAEATARAATRELEATTRELEGARAEAASREQRVTDTSEEARAHRIEVEVLREELTEQRRQAEQAAAELELSRAQTDELQAEIHRAHEAVAQLRKELVAERSQATDALEQRQHTEQERGALTERIEKLARQLEEAGAENAELNRRLQEIESRRQLELADDQGKAEIDDLLRVTQERLAGQTEKLMATEDRARELEGQLTSALERIEVAETELRTHRMSEALKEMRDAEHTDHVEAVPDANAAVIEDRRAASPFTKELSLDAKKTLARIMGVTQILKHKKDAKEQAQLIRQLTTYARRLDHTVADLAEADVLARGQIELQIKRTDLDALVARVVEESGVESDHDVRVHAEALVIGVDPRRTEQIVSGLLRASGERTATGREIVVRLEHADGGAMISVEDPEPSSDASLSPVVKRFVEAQGGWAKVESREDGGSAFRVFLPDAAPVADDVQVLVDGEATPEAWDGNAGEILVQELHRLAELPVEEGKASGRSRRAGRKG